MSGVLLIRGKKEFVGIEQISVVVQKRI